MKITQIGTNTIVKATCESDEALDKLSFTIHSWDADRAMLLLGKRGLGTLISLRVNADELRDLKSVIDYWLTQLDSAQADALDTWETD